MAHFRETGRIPVRKKPVSVGNCELVDAMVGVGIVGW